MNSYLRWSCLLALGVGLGWFAFGRSTSGGGGGGLPGARPGLPFNQTEFSLAPKLGLGASARSEPVRAVS